QHSLAGVAFSLKVHLCPHWPRLRYAAKIRSVPRHLIKLDRMDFYSAAAGSELGTFALGLIIAGVVGGLVAGMLGVGGGIVVVPVLYHVLALLGVDVDARMHIAVATSLATIIPTSVSSVRSHNLKGAV